MNITLEEILMVIISFLIGWFLRTMIGSDKSQQKIKVNTDKHNKNTRANTSVGVGVGDDFDMSCDSSTVCPGSTSCNHTCQLWDSSIPFYRDCLEWGNYCN